MSTKKGGISSRPFKVIYKNLKKAWGYSDLSNNTIEMDTKLVGKKHMEILIHECVHLLWPDATEEEVESKSIKITNTMWKEGYRWVDTKNIIPMQNGTK
jgi:hypothetical protein